MSQERNSYLNFNWKIMWDILRWNTEIFLYNCILLQKSKLIFDQFKLQQKPVWYVNQWFFLEAYRFRAKFHSSVYGVWCFHDSQNSVLIETNDHTLANFPLINLPLNTYKATRWRHLSRLISYCQTDDLYFNNCFKRQSKFLIK